jgi:phosphatidate cytidylyltransferase
LRAASAAVLIPVVLAALWAGGVWFTFLAGLIAIAVAYEWTRIVHPGDEIQFALHAAGALAGALLPLADGLGVSILAVLVISVIAFALKRDGSTLWSLLGVPYAGLPVLALVTLRSDPNLGFEAILWVLLVVWATDTAAYFFGRLIGGPKLAPRISPKKTWAGSIGGVAAGAVAGAVAGALIAGSGAALALPGLLLSIVAQLGDLFKSALKRRYGLKDTGNLIPGHGGIIDRADGVIAAVVLAAAIGLARAGPGLAAHGLLVWYP